MAERGILMTAEIRQRRKDIRINVSGIKEWLNQPHKHYTEKNEALLRLPKLLNESE